jgi:hypothetical protein
MNPIDRSHQIRVTSSASPSGTAWTVLVTGESHAVFTGGAARPRAVEYALRLAEDLRTTGAVLVVVDSSDGGDKTTRVVRNRLAS